MTLVNTLANACFGVMMQIMLYLVDFITFKRCTLVSPTAKNVNRFVNSSSPLSVNTTEELPFICYTSSQFKVEFYLTN